MSDKSHEITGTKHEPTRESVQKVYQDILRLIETVDPSDTAKMDEIDRLVEVFIDPRWTIYSRVSHWNGDLYWEKARTLSDGKPFNQSITQYTRSRDALKAIRPEGFASFAIPHDQPEAETQLFTWSGTCEKLVLVDERDVFIGPECATEELAELHAIISAIQWERENG